MARFTPSIVLVAVFLLSACSNDAALDRVQPPESPTTSSGPSPSDSPPASPTPIASGRCGSDVYPTPDPDRPRYDMTLHMDGGPSVRGRTAVDFTPDLATGRLVFRLWPNGPDQAQAGARLTTRRVAVDGDRAGARLVNPTTLVVPLEDRLAAGEEISASVVWRLQLPGPVTDRISLDGQSYRLGSFFPILSWVPGEGWATDPPTTSFAEANISPTADFDVDVRVPDGFQVLASGTEVSRGHWRATEVRDFALAAGPFDVGTGTAHVPHPVKIAVGVDRAIEADPNAWVQQVVADLEGLSKRFGSYPWPTFNLAIMSSLSSAGIEYPTMVFQGPETLGQTTSHELGHMWFYSLVGSNPARDAWLDEGLTSWAESTVQDSLAEFMAYPIPPEAQGQMGKPMTFWDQFTDNTYYFGVYAQPVHALGSLNDPADVNCGLRSYVSQHAFGIAEPDDLLAALRPLIPNVRGVLERFGARF
jgi:Peptidase family M1 domain